MKPPMLLLCLSLGIVGIALALVTCQGPSPVPVSPSAERVVRSPEPPSWDAAPVVQSAAPAVVAQGAEEVSEPLPPALPAEAAPHGHAADYTWLTGELRYAEVRQAWCLRYATAEERDPYGGSVTLLLPEDITSLSSGQVVRVEGELLDLDSHEPSPYYRVRALAPLR